MKEPIAPNRITDTPRTKRSYRAPAIVSSDAFERLALTCSGNAQHRKKNPPTSCTTVGSS
jgi:hypothetical protein